MERPNLRPIETLDMDTLLALAERKAVAEADGHLSLFRFTNGWKCMLGTPDLDSGGGRNQVRALEMHPTFREALISFLIRKRPGQR